MGYCNVNLLVVKIGITCYPTYGGSGIVATELGLELAARGHEIHFISYANPIRLDPGLPRIHYHEVEVSAYPLFLYPPYCLALASRMAEVAACYDLDLLHVHYAIPHSIAALLAQQMMACRRALPFITTLHGTDITLVGADRSYFPITKFSIEKSDGITAISNYLQERTKEVFGVANEIRVIHNFVNCDLYKPDPERQPKEKQLIHLSNFRPVKRVLDCVRILKEVLKSTPAHLVMVGDGPERGPAEMLARELGSRRARFVPGQAGSCRVSDSKTSRAADAERNGSLRISRARSNGMWIAAGRDPRRRSFRVDLRWRGRISRACRRHRGASVAGGFAAYRRCALSTNVRGGKALSGDALFDLSDHSSVRAVLQGSLRTMNILAIGPHPDDIEFGCAPILIKEVRAGTR